MSLVPFGWRVLWLKLTTTRKINSALGRLGQIALVQSGWWLDDIFFRSWKQASFHGPVIILGHQRTGTTIVHRALCAAPEAAGASLAQMLFPALSLWRLARQGLRLDARLGSRVSAAIEARQAKRFAALDHLHRTRLDEVEEDEIYFWTILASGMCANSGANSMDNRQLDFLRRPSTWDEQRREAIWTWYESVLKKLACYRVATRELSSPPWIIVKNPAFSYRIPELISRFPHARFLVLHREPCDAIASRLNLVQSIWSLAGREQTLSAEHVEIIYQDSLKIFRGLEQDVCRIPANRCLELSFEQLRASPDQTMARIETAFGIRAKRMPPPAPPRSRARLSDFGLQESRVHHDLAELYRRKAWEAS